MNKRARAADPLAPFSRIRLALFTRFFSVFAIMATLGCCGGPGPSGSSEVDADLNVNRSKLRASRLADTLVVHEWGTFTSVQGTDGKSLFGLHHEEESLPDFVHHRDYQAKQLNIKMNVGHGSEITQKLETPVIYMYPSKAMTVDVSVDFPRGVFTEWYPDTTVQEPDATVRSPAPRDGHAHWRVLADPHGDESKVPAVSDADIWAPSRRTKAAVLRAKSEHEKHIFYRGVGQFDLPITVKATATTVRVHNSSTQDIPAALLLRNDGDGASVTTLGAIPAGQTVDVPRPKQLQSVASYSEKCRTTLLSALIGAGLYADEAHAMIDTWERSWLHHQGLRVLYIVPREWTDELLPLQITPRPTVLERVLVGRIEVLTPEVEAEAVTLYEAAIDPSDLLPLKVRLGRFAEAVTRRACQLLERKSGADAFLATQQCRQAANLLTAGD